MGTQEGGRLANSGERAPFDLTKGCQVLCCLRVCTRVCVGKCVWVRETGPRPTHTRSAVLICCDVPSVGRRIWNEFNSEVLDFLTCSLLPMEGRALTSLL